jgi:hypothetical protein
MTMTEQMHRPSVAIFPSAERHMIKTKDALAYSKHFSRGNAGEVIKTITIHFIMVAKYHMFETMQSLNELLVVFESKITKYIHSVFLANKTIPIINQRLIHFLYGRKWALAMFQYGFVLKVGISDKPHIIPVLIIFHV